MQAFQLAYYGMSGVQHPAFKPTLAAALLASGLGSYLSYGPLPSELKQESPANPAGGDSGYEAISYGLVKRVETPRSDGIVAVTTKAGNRPDAQSLVAVDFGPGASVAVARLDLQSQALQRFQPQMDRGSSVQNAGPSLSLKEFAKAEPAADAIQPTPLRSVVTAGPAVLQAAPKLDLGSDGIGIESTVAIANVTRFQQSDTDARTALAASQDEQPGLRSQDSAIEGDVEMAIADARQSPSTKTIEAAAFAIAKALPSSPSTADEAVTKLGSGAAAGVPEGEMIVHPAALAAMAVSPAAPPQDQASAEPVAAPASGTGAASLAEIEPAARPSQDSDLLKPAEPAQLTLAPITFKLTPVAKSSLPSAGLAAARRSEHASAVTKPQLNGSTVQKQARVPDRLVGDYILHQVGVRLNDSPVGMVDVRIGGEASLSIQVGVLLSVVKEQMDPGLFAALSASAGTGEYVSFHELRAAGIDVRYEPAEDTIVLTAD